MIPKAYTNNTPEALAERLQPFMQHLPSFPFGTDFTKDELNILMILNCIQDKIYIEVFLW